jgi:ribosome-associated heat shock protein Hsp15
MSEESLRLDKWLWYARFFKSRSLAAKVCQASKVRSAGNPISKAHHPVRVGDVLTFPKGRYIRVIKVLALGTRRGPAAEAQTLYEDLNPPESAQAMPRLPGLARRPAGEGRPTKKDRRDLDKLQGRD